jgi:endonuclease G
MRLLRAFIPICVALLALASCGDDSNTIDLPDAIAKNTNRNLTGDYPEASRIEIPRLKGNGTLLLVHKTSDKEGVNFSVEWDREKKAQRWTAYRIHRGLSGNAGYYGTWEEDPDLPASARVDDSYSYYRGSGFGRGHICASADRQYSKEANRQTFFYTNMQPQYQIFNAGPKINGTQQYTSPWVRLEDKVRQWGRSSSCDTLYVVKGGTIEDNQLLGKIRDVLPIPKYFFVALLMKSKDDYRAIGFWIEHDNLDHGDDPLGDYAVNIDELERLTGIDFFCNLPDDVEEQKESQTVANAKLQWGLK